MVVNSIQRNENEHRADNDRSAAMGIIINNRQQRRPPINRHSHRKVHRSRWMVKCRQILQWWQQRQQPSQPQNPDKSKRKRNKSTMSMWQSIWWVWMRSGPTRATLQFSSIYFISFHFSGNEKREQSNTFSTWSKSFLLNTLKQNRKRNESKHSKRVCLLLQPRILSILAIFAVLSIKFWDKHTDEMIRPQ